MLLSGGQIAAQGKERVCAHVILREGAGINLLPFLPGVLLVQPKDFCLSPQKRGNGKSKLSYVATFAL